MFIFICLLSNFQTIFSIKFNYMNLVSNIYFIRLIILSRTHSRSLPLDYNSFTPSSLDNRFY
ncbi:hypothetical protein COC60_22475 [Bacillus thuringiensis]|uniref:Uncharacterized protein n=1 Tax=Bacillus thuringiensis TaxID=1428 RepID=A0A9X6V4M4_BACTU|nr:hypothetical protein DOS87_21550 [Bacillus sp. CR71]AXR24212.1 hypothetical protein DPQ26_21565 [Bacillus sp. E25]AZV67528.1 hypothetical protein DT426_18320 [Bacillus cereus]KAA0780850.1 hypothetical protein DN406_31860 [Bacillus sp. BB56-3]OTX57990.1 hypothetical protein BK719_33800 [Bacillus thuringiensis serovar novosibirsk]OTY37058.1 hypothetical protein BK745_17635 [Bacillus thuringiensis serovar alesti]OTZ25201.1 hypothetical protein BK763_33330 [Bacillus thuringiensis serovar thomp